MNSKNAAAVDSNDAALPDTTTERRSYLPLFIGLFAVLPYSSLLLSGNLVLRDDGMYSDYGSFQLPVREFVSHELAEGRFPHWIPWLGCGIPLHATQQVGICYPLLTPMLFFFNANMAIKVSLFLHVIICYWGQYQLGRQLKLSIPGASIAALICTQSGFLCTHLAVGHVALVLAYSLVPWLLCCVVRICDAPSLRRSGGFAAVVAGLLLTGHPQIPYYALLFGGIWAAISLAVGAAASRRRAVVAAFALGLMIGIAIAAVQILPTWELFRNNGSESMRGTAEYASTYALNGLDLYRLLIPSLFGNPMVDIPEFAAPNFYHEKVCYLGVITWCLAIIGFGLVISLGNSTPLFSWLCATVPGLTLFRCPGRCLSMVSILIALLAGRGFDSLTEQTTVLSRRAEVGLTAIFVFLVLAIGNVADKTVLEIDAARWIEFAKINLRWEFESSAIAVLAAIITCWLTPRFSARIGPLVVAVIVVLDLGYFNLRCIQFEDHFSVRLTDADVVSIGTQRFIDGDTGFGSQEVRYSRCVAAAVKSETRMIGTNEGGVLPLGCEVLYQALSKNPDVTLRVAACQYVAKQPSSLQRRSDIALPRIWFCPNAREYLLDKPIHSLTANDVEQVLAAANETKIEVVADDSQRTEVKVTSATDGTLVVADTWYPGWECQINGTNGAIRQVFQCFRGVRIFAGSNFVNWRFNPQSFSEGRWLSIVGLGFLFTMSIAQQTKRFVRPYLFSATGLDCRNKRSRLQSAAFQHSASHSQEQYNGPSTSNQGQIGEEI
jgi:hypothetical protein